MFVFIPFSKFQLLRFYLSACIYYIKIITASPLTCTRSSVTHFGRSYRYEQQFWMIQWFILSYKYILLVWYKQHEGFGVSDFVQGWRFYQVMWMCISQGLLCAGYVSLQIIEVTAVWLIFPWEVQEASFLENSQKSPYPLQHLNKLCPSSHRRKLWLWFRFIKNNPCYILFCLFVTILNLQMLRFKCFACKCLISRMVSGLWNIILNLSHSTRVDFQFLLVFIKHSGPKINHLWHLDMFVTEMKHKKS